MTATAVPADQITIVSGLPRSGTSMMMRMLEAGGIPPLTDNIRTADEDNPRGYYEFEPVKKTKEDATWLQTAGGKAVKLVYRLLYDLPADHQYHVIFMRRELSEVIRSQNAMLQRLGKQSGALPEDKLQAMFAAQIAEFLDWAAKQPNFHLLQVDYNQMLQDPQPLVTQVNEFLGGKLDAAQMRQVVEPQLYRQRSNKD